MSDAQSSRVGSMFGPYHLKRLLGRGGMGEVYEAEHTVKEWTVAVKVMSERFSQDPEFRERMKREARIAGRLQEPHVVPIHDYGEIDGQMFLEMRLILGTDLDKVLKRYGPLTPPRAVAIITQIASALDAAHAAGVMHRDVKPPNILVTGDDFAYLVDFGIASAVTEKKLTQLGTMLGTWKYMAPERLSNEEADYRADIYALACVLYECLTGSPPFDMDNNGRLITAHLMDPIPRPSAVRAGIPRGLDAVIARGMAKRPEDRYASAGDLALAAHAALSDPDQDRAANIVRRSQEATLPTPDNPQPPPTLAGTAMAPPSPTPGYTTPPPAHHYPAASAPTSGPISRAAPTNRPWAGDARPAPPHYQANERNWGAPPPNSPPPQHFTAPWGQPPPGPKRNPWPLVAGVAALVVVLVLAAIGISMAIGGDDNPQPRTTAMSTPRMTTTTPTIPKTTPTGNEMQGKLLSMLPAGYPAGACTPTTPKPNSVWTSALAMVDCGQNTNQGGPSKGVYGLFPNPDVLTQAFHNDVYAPNVSLMNCPGAGSSPDGWHHDNSPTVTAGQIACATFKGHTNLVWSNQAKLMLCDVFGDPPTMEDLHTWWSDYGG